MLELHGYFRVRAEFPGFGIADGQGRTEEELRATFQQLAADVEHSDLLVRLLKGEKPLSHEEWLARRPGAGQ